MAPAANEKFQQRLLARQQYLSAEIARMEAEGEQVAQADSPDIVDRATRDYDRESLFQQIGQVRSELALVNEALGRLAGGTFGKCVDCGRPVEPKRLEAVPWARYCLDDQQKHDRGML